MSESEKDPKQRLADAQLLLSILDHLPTSIFVKDEDLKFVYSNRAHCNMIGKPEEDLLGNSDADFYQATEARDYLLRDQKVLDSGQPNEIEEMVVRKSGESRPVLTRKARLRSPDGKIYLIGTNSDLTDIKKRENQYRALSETVPVGVLQIDEDGKIAFSNPLLNVYSGGDGTVEAREQLIEKLKQSHKDFPGVACKFEAEIMAIGAPRRSVIVISSGWLWIGEGKRSAIVSIIDVSEMMELRQMNEEVSRLNRELAANMKKLSAAQDELVKKGRMEQLGQLTATIAHELRNPLGAVRTSAFLLERKITDKGPGVETQLDRINKGIVRCDNIITQLLDFSRSKQLNSQPADLDHWLSQVLEEEARRLPSVVSISCELGLASRLVPFDPSRLQRAIVNLMSNACEAMVGQGDDPTKFAVAEPHIRISTQLVGDHVAISVVDNGPGIPEGVMARIREPLFTTKSFGTGLGVPAIEQIAVQHGGQLEIQSEVGQGATFTIRIPAVKVEDEAA